MAGEARLGRAWRGTARLGKARQGKAWIKKRPCKARPQSLIDRITLMATKKSSVVEVSPMNIEIIEITIVGITPLITHAWSEKAKQEMLDRQRKTKKGAKHETKIPVNDFMNSLNWLTDKPEDGETDAEAEENWLRVKDSAKFGFPCTGIKESIVSGAYRAGLDVKMTDLRANMFLLGNTDASTSDYAEIISDPPTMREDMVRVGGSSKSADIRYRAEFKEWEIPLRIRFQKDGKYSLEQIVNMVNYGGFGTGIGEWRPERKGQFGMYELKVQS